MFFHEQELRYAASPAAPDAVYARRMQEILGGQYGEITVATQHGLQAWNAHLQVARIFQMTGDPGVRDMLSCLIARDTVHQQQRTAAEELRAERIEDLPEDASFPATPAAFPPPTQPDPRPFGTTPKPGLLEKAEGVIKDEVSRK